VIGEAKYNPQRKDLPARMTDSTLTSLGLKKGGSRKMPIFMHLAETLVPLGSGSRFTVVKAPMPPLFMKVVKLLSLFKK
jgi:hypothetical protein